MQVETPNIGIRSAGLTIEDVMLNSSPRKHTVLAGDRFRISIC
jgi:hypothetical protein